MSFWLSLGDRGFEGGRVRSWARLPTRPACDTRWGLDEAVNGALAPAPPAFSSQLGLRPGLEGYRPFTHI